MKNKPKLSKRERLYRKRLQEEKINKSYERHWERWGDAYRRSCNPKVHY